MTGSTLPPSGGQPGRGRPLDADRTAAIIEATRAVLHERGWFDFTMEDIADEAGCGLATIYRRWNTKEDLIASAMAHTPLPAFEESGDPATDLHRMIEAVANQVLTRGALTPGFLTMTKRDPVLHDAFKQGVLNIARPKFKGMLAALIETDAADVGYVCDAIVGSIIWRAELFDDTLTPKQHADDALALVRTLASGLP